MQLAGSLKPNTRHRVRLPRKSDGLSWFSEFLRNSKPKDQRRQVGLFDQSRCIMSDIVFGGRSDIWRTDLGYASVRSPDIRPATSDDILYIALLLHPHAISQAFQNGLAVTPNTKLVMTSTTEKWVRTLYRHSFPPWSLHKLAHDPQV